MTTPAQPIATPAVERERIERDCLRCGRVHDGPRVYCSGCLAEVRGYFFKQPEERDDAATDAALEDRT